MEKYDAFCNKTIDIRFRHLCLKLFFLPRPYCLFISKLGKKYQKSQSHCHMTIKSSHYGLGELKGNFGLLRLDS